MNLLRLIAIALAASLVLCLLMAYRKHSKMLTGMPREGKVVSYVSSGKHQKLRIEYLTQNGQRQEAVSKTASKPPSKRIGDTVTVLHYADGSTPDVLIFTETYFLYLLWFVVSFSAAVAVTSGWWLKAIYARTGL